MYQDLITKAHAFARPIQPSESCSAGGVAALIVAESGDEFTGICMEFSCSLGFCAEHAAVAEMLKHQQAKIKFVVAVDWSGKVLPPCGRCREMLWQLEPSNKDALVILNSQKAIPLHELLPFPWQSA